MSWCRPAAGRSSTLLVLASVVAGALMGCAEATTVSGTPVGPSTARVSVPSTVGDVRLAVGDTLAVEFGIVNLSVGDQWRVAEDPDPEVLAEMLADGAGADQEPPPPGSATRLTMRFVAVAPGSTSLTFQYSHRGGPGSPPDSGPSRRTVTVTVAGRP